jgi:acetate kinase
MRALTPLVLAVNRGSSSLKYALFTVEAPEQVAAGNLPPATTVPRIMAALEPHLQTGALAGIVHRVVHGGDRFDRTHRITPAVIDGLRALIPLAPNHLPDEIALIEAFAQARPGIPQVACFDTAFHRDLPAISRTLPVPAAPGLRRYGFHGLSYAFLMSELAGVDPAAAAGHVVLAHLGNGASLAAVAGGRCIDTSMGLTPAGGLVMSTRAGDIDPGVIAYMARTRRLPVEQIDELLTRDSGLRAISGGSADMQVLLSQEQTDPRARLAVDIFCYQVRKWIGAFAAALGGLETLVFAGGIGEHAPAIRERICRELAFLGVELDEPLNAGNAAVVSAVTARVCVRVIATNEALAMAREAHPLLREPLQPLE